MSEPDVSAIAREVARILGQPSAQPLITARDVAAMLGVSPWWVYEHAQELGVVQLGDGPRPRLRFDRAVVAQRLLPRVRPPDVTAKNGGASSSRSDLLPIKGPRSPRPSSDQR